MSSKLLVACAFLGSALLLSVDAVSAPPPVAPWLTVGATLKQLTFNWPSVPGATSYRLFRNPDGNSGFTQVGPDLPADAMRTTLDLAVHQHDWMNALYRLEACNANGCSGSAAQSAAPAMLQAIGYFKASNTGVGDFFGIELDVSSDGNTLAIGASAEASRATGIDSDQSDDGANRSGAVYVFVRNGSTWSQQAYLKASNAEGEDRFGSALSLSADGSTLIVGARIESSSAKEVGGDQSNNNAPAAGAAYVFARIEGQWVQQAYLKAPNTEAGDEFGFPVALSADGKTAAVGARLEDSSAKGVGGDQSDNTATNAGAVYVFVRNAATWVYESYVKASNTEAADEFGQALALSADGNTLAVAAPREDSSATGINGNALDNLAGNSGAVYVFARNGATWSQQAYVKASNTGGVDRFGSSVALSADGDTLAVGAVGERSKATGVGGNQLDDSAFFAGAAYVLTRAGGQWSQQAYVKASNTEAFQEFGFSLDLSADGNTLAVSAVGESGEAIGVGGDPFDHGAESSGAVYVLKRAAGLWSHEKYVKASNTGSFDAFGVALALSADGDTLAVGASSEGSRGTGVGDDQSNDDAPTSGAAYLY
jgi:trimeric autotransporter adhesin